MPRDVALDTLYNGPINLWVEDDLTRAYLGALWNDPAVKFLPGGGYDGVNAMTKYANHAGYANVFGMVDGDRGRSNYEDWFVPGRTFRGFVLPRHEIENYLLDTPALEGCRFNTHQRTAAEIDSHLDAEAASRSWCEACRDVVSHVRDRFFDRFIEQPKTPPVETETAARDHITRSDWFRALESKSSGMTEARVRRLLERAHAHAARRLRDGSWRENFSGKELLHVIGNKIYNRAAESRSGRPSTAQFPVDLAKTVASWQVANGSVPTDLSDLLAALKARVSP